MTIETFDLTNADTKTILNTVRTIDHVSRQIQVTECFDDIKARVVWMEEDDVIVVREYKYVKCAQKFVRKLQDTYGTLVTYNKIEYHVNYRY